MLTETQEKFIARRKTLTKLWNWIGTFSLIFVVAFWGYFFNRSPLLFNPFYLSEQLESGLVSVTTLTVLAAVGSAAFLVCGFLLAVIIILVLVSWLMKGNFSGS